MNERQSMDEGIPDCPDCDGKGMCDKHRCEYLEWVYNTARNEYLAAIREHRAKLIKDITEMKTERIKQDELSSS